MSFIDVRFPEDISYGSAGGPVYNTSIIVTSSGREKRNINWEYPRCEYDVSYGVKELYELEDLLAFFHIVLGKAHTFRYKDFSDYKSCRRDNTPNFLDQEIGTGDGATTEFQLYKNYSFGSFARRSRKITKPVSGTVSVGIDDSEVSNYSIDHTTGKITFDTAPSNGANITAGYEFDVEARFDTDSLPVNLDDYNEGSIDVPVIEIKGI